VLLVDVFIMLNMRRFSERLLRRGKVVAIPKKSEGERLDKFVMGQLGLKWVEAQKLIRMKRAFVVGSDEGKYVYRDAAYKLIAGDSVCLPRDLKKVAEFDGEGELLELEDGK